MHGYQLSQCLIERGHKVIFVTNSFKSERTGTKTYQNGIKIYYLPLIPVIAGDVAFFTFWHCYPVLRDIFIRE